MVPDDPILADEQQDLAGSVADEARYRRRRAAFRRRLTTTVIGIVLVIAVVLWQRNRSYVQNCATSLQAYGKTAQSMYLGREPVELIESNWDDLNVGAPVSPTHYKVLVNNWPKQPESGEAIPLAMCKEAHGSITGSGRHVLYRTVNGLEVRWVKEATADKLLAASGDRSN